MKDDKNEPMPGRGHRLLEVTRGQNERQKCLHTKGGGHARYMGRGFS